MIRSGSAPSSPSQFHAPVMLEEVMADLDPAIRRFTRPWLMDGTFGRGGHSREFLRRYPELRIFAVDQDPEAIAFAKVEFAKEILEGRLVLRQQNFSELHGLEIPPFAAALLDLGVSSPQLDNPARGFSFYGDGPLDMRMNPDQGIPASQWLQEATEDELVQCFRDLGEVQRPHRVVRAIVHDRKSQPFVSTLQLAGLIERVDGWRRKGFHPATQYFMALRLQVNGELEILDGAIRRLLLGLGGGGRLAVLTFHSLEDRIVKNLFRSIPDLGEPVRRKVVVANREEVLSNPRSRSAKLRVFEKAEDADSISSSSVVPQESGSF